MKKANSWLRGSEAGFSYLSILKLKPWGICDGSLSRAHRPCRSKPPYSLDNSVSQDSRRSFLQDRDATPSAATSPTEPRPMSSTASGSSSPVTRACRACAACCKIPKRPKPARRTASAGLTITRSWRVGLAPIPRGRILPVWISACRVKVRIHVSFPCTLSVYEENEMLFGGLVIDVF